MDLNGWLGQAVAVRNDISATIAHLRELDARWRSLEEALREAINVKSAGPRAVAKAPDGVGV
jgi:hypothetical protein